ncbi:MAG: hypothetical protein AVDCRST_MAG54-4535, partial [uncultured Actinomycetospora sp.]
AAVGTRVDARGRTGPRHQRADAAALRSQRPGHARDHAPVGAVPVERAQAAPADRHGRRGL